MLRNNWPGLKVPSRSQFVPSHDVIRILIAKVTRSFVNEASTLNNLVPFILGCSVDTVDSQEVVFCGSTMNCNWLTSQTFMFVLSLVFSESIPQVVALVLCNIIFP